MDSRDAEKGRSEPQHHLQAESACAYCGRAIPRDSGACPHCRRGGALDNREALKILGDVERVRRRFTANGAWLVLCIVFMAASVVSIAVFSSEAVGLAGFVFVVSLITAVVLLTRQSRSKSSLRGRPDGCVEVLIRGSATMILFLIAFCFAVVFGVSMLCS